MKNDFYHKRISVLKLFSMFLLFFYMISGFAISDLHVPSSIVYIGDIINIFLFLGILRQKKIVIGKNLVNFIIVFIILLMWSTFVTVINGSSIILYFWGMRQTFRFFLFFISSSFIFQIEDVKRIIKIMSLLQVFNVLICTYYRFILNAPVDNIGGIFGKLPGVSAAMNVFLLILTCFYFLEYLINKGSLIKFIIILFSSIYIAAISDLKVLFVEIVVFGFIILIKTKSLNLKTILVVFCGIAIMNFGNNYINSINYYGYREDKSSGILSAKNIIENVTRESGYDGTGDVNRGTVLQKMYTVAFYRDPVRAIFGMGLGSTEFSQSFKSLTSQFYLKYRLLNYQYFQSGILFVEIGVVGMFLFLFLFIQVLWNMEKIFKNSKLSSDELVMVNLAFLMAIFSLIMVFYNTTLKMDSCSYLVLTILAIPNMIERKNKL